MVKSTYVLDVETAETLDRLAGDWQTSKSEALRRLIKAAGRALAPDRVARFRRLQAAVKLRPADANAWAGAVRAERQTMGVRRAARRK